jgi:flagellar export protein FliJ
MAKFVLGLEAVLRLRRATRDERRGQLAAAYDAHQSLQRQAAQLSRDLDVVQLTIRATSGAGVIDVDTLRDAQRYERQLTSRQQQLAVEIQSASEAIERQRALLVEADQQVRLLATLSELRQQEFAQQQQKAAIHEMDEASARSHILRSSRRL